MTESILLISIAFLLSLGFALWLVPFIRKQHLEKNLTIEDMNKKGHPRIPGLGGIALVFAFILAITLTIALKLIFGFDSINLNLLLPALLSIMMMAFVGFADDILMFPFRPIKPILALLASIPMIIISYSGNTVIRLPLIDNEINVGLLYPLIFIPLIVAFSANAFNIMADFDGLAPGNGLVISAALFISSVIAGQPTSALLFASLFGVLLVFFFYNKYPAKLFTGNIGTLFVGSIFAIGAILGNLKYAFFIVMIPYLIHFLLQERIIFEEKRILARPRERGIPQNDGTIKSEYKKSYGLTHLLMRHSPKMTEKKLVYYLMGIEAVFAIIAILFHFQHLNLIH
jgi:UDP-N-acetylglucosamine--dolichyl-phosphate N-acetylglucosaminephosphotransferase